jgi:WD40 repeat protein
MGISSLSLFPSSFNSNNNTRLAIAYGGSSVKKGDNNAMLISIRQAASPPILHWKCRLPETEMSGGLIVSPCGYYIVGGGASGSCYVWTSLGGKLLTTFKSHYRACTCLEWSDCGRYLVTGGADGMIHMFSLMNLVDVSTRSSRRGVSPMHTFSVHHFPVTSLIQLPSGRMASASEDGQVLVLELFSRLILLNIHLPHGIKSMAHENGRLFFGSIQGTVY